MAVLAIWLALCEQAGLNLDVAATDCHRGCILGSCVAAQDLVDARATRNLDIIDQDLVIDCEGRVAGI